MPSAEQRFGTVAEGVSRWMSETGNPDYRSAFAKLLLYGE
jgi:hypothetical protein